MTATYKDDSNADQAVSGVTPRVATTPTSITVTAGNVNNNDPPTSVTLDLESTQSLTTSSTQVKLTVTADKAMSLTLLTNLVLKSSSTTIPLTCSFSTAVECTAGTPKEVTCTFTSALTAGSYQLNVADSQTISMTATYKEFKSKSNINSRNRRFSNN